MFLNTYFFILEETCAPIVVEKVPIILARIVVCLKMSLQTDLYDVNCVVINVDFDSIVFYYVMQ